MAKASRCRIWHLKPNIDPAMLFIGYEDLLTRFGGIDSSKYTSVFDGFVQTSDLESIYTIFRENFPVGYSGRKIGLGDVVELNGKFHYCDRVGFRDITREWNKE